jgi:hypothetical protein
LSVASAFCSLRADKRNPRSSAAAMRAFSRHEQTIRWW